MKHRTLMPRMRFAMNSTKAPPRAPQPHRLHQHQTVNTLQLRNATQRNAIQQASSPFDPTITCAAELSITSIPDPEQDPNNHRQNGRRTIPRVQAGRRGRAEPQHEALRRGHARGMCLPLVHRNALALTCSIYEQLYGLYKQGTYADFSKATKPGAFSFRVCHYHSSPPLQPWGGAQV